VEEHNSPDSVTVWVANRSELVAELDDLAEEVEKSMRDETLCQKCSCDLGFGWAYKENERTLLGGYKCNICTECVNRWTDYLITGVANNVHDRLIDIKREIGVVKNCYVTTGGGKVAEALVALKPLYAQETAVEKELYTLGKEWIADKLPVPAATGVTP